MKKIILAILMYCSIISVSQAASTYWVNLQGGNATQCNGLSDKPYTPVVSDVTHDCAVNHPNWILAPQGSNPSKLVGGDTMMIDYGQYMIGYGAPNTSDGSKCSTNWTWDCWERNIPSGPDAQHPTRVLGTGFDTGCANPPQLWGTERVNQIINLNGSNNIEVQCLEVTDHSECLQNGPDAATRCNRDTYPHGLWANTGLAASDSANVLLKNVEIHGVTTGVLAGRLKDWTLDTVIITGNTSADWNGDLGGGNSSNSGTMHFINTKIRFAGCGEKLDGTPYNCFGQDQGGYGDGLGTGKTGAKWIFDNCDFSNNVSDGLDLLYHDGTAPVIINGGTYVNNAGNDVKLATTATLNQVTVNGQCDWFNKNPQYLYQPSGFNNCRALGNAISLAFGTPGQKIVLNGGSVAGNGDVLVVTGGSGCNGTESVTANGTVFTPSPVDFPSPDKATSVFYNAGAGGNGDGPCGVIKFIQNATPVIPPPPSTCTSNGSCSAAVPACGKTTTGVDNCGTSCTKTGPACCVSTGVCTANSPVACGVFTPGKDNCGNPCTVQPVPCCVSNGSCTASPACEQTAIGVDNCGKACSKVGPSCATINSASVSITCNGKTYSLSK